MTGSTFFGLDVHSRTIAIAQLAPFSKEPVVTEIPNDPSVVRRTFQRFMRENREIRCCYEAGPCGYVLQRQLAGLKIQCDVVAPSLIPKKPGERIKTAAEVTDPAGFAVLVRLSAQAGSPRERLRLRSR